MKRGSLKTRRNLRQKARSLRSEKLFKELGGLTDDEIIALIEIDPNTKPIAERAEFVIQRRAAIRVFKERQRLADEYRCLRESIASLEVAISKMSDQELNSYAKTKRPKKAPIATKVLLLRRRTLAQTELKRRASEIDTFLNERQPRNLQEILFLSESIAKPWLTARAIQQFHNHLSSVCCKMSIEELNTRLNIPNNDKKTASILLEAKKKLLPQLSFSRLQMIAASIQQEIYTDKDRSTAKSLLNQYAKLRQLDIREFYDVAATQGGDVWSPCIVHSVVCERKPEMLHEQNRRRTETKKKHRFRDDGIRPRWV